MSDLTDFLLARIEEDDRMARATFSTQVARDCEAKRQIIETFERRWDEAERAANDPDLTPRERQAMHSMYASQATGLGQALHHLATVYADHPDYREEWRPGQS